MNSIRTGLIAAALLAAGSATAAELFEAAITVQGGGSVERGFDAIEPLLEQFREHELSQENIGYTPSSGVSAELRLRGMEGVRLGYAPGSTVLQLSIPRLGINEQFAGHSRDQSEDLLEDWFKGEGRAALTRLLQALVEESPVDPVAGNPASLMTRMVDAGFDSALQAADAGSNLRTGAAGAAMAAGMRSNFVSVSARFGQYSQREFDAKTLQIPLSWTHVFDNPRYALIVDAPVTYVDTQGAESYAASVGIGLKIDTELHGWSLIPALRAGATGSEDLGAAALIYAGSLTSVYQVAVAPGWRFKLANLASHLVTQDLDIGGYRVAYDLRNFIYRNGVFLEQDAGWRLFGAPLFWEYHYVRTDYKGDALFSTWSNEVGISLGSRLETATQSWTALRFGLNFIEGEHDIRGVTGNLGYTF